MPAASSDLNLLFGMLALQLDFITKDQLLGSMQAWILDKSKSISRILVEQGALSPDKQQLLNALVKKHVEAHGNDPQQSMASLEVRVFARDALKKVRDPDVHASLMRMKDMRPVRGEPPVRGEQQYNTVAPSSSGKLGAAAESRFRILRPHAKGGLGVVFVARDEEIGREVALKEIQIQLARDEDSRNRFILEAEITGGLEHPGIVPVYGLGRYADGRPYYAMRFIRGDSLKEAVDHFHAAEDPGRDRNERSQAMRQLLRRFTDVCNAIEYAHSKGVLHRDLKPGNIMLGKYGETLVVDWGLAKAQVSTDSSASLDLNETPLMPSSIGDSSHTQMGSAIGTPAFMSPEQAAGRLDLLGPTSDVYSLGATLYYILTGQPSVMSPDIAEVLRCVQHGDFSPPREINPLIERPLEAICLKAMAREPAARYASSAELCADVNRWLDDSPVLAWREPLSVKVRRWINQHRTLATATVAGVLVAMLSLGAATLLLTKVNDDLAKANGVAEEKRKEADEQSRLAKENEKKEIIAREEAVKQEEIAKKQTRIAELNEKKADEARKEADRQRTRAEWQVYSGLIALAQASWQENNVKDAFELLQKCEPKYRGWEHRYLESVWNKGLVSLKGHTFPVTGVAFLSGGRVVSGSQDRSLRIWDAAAGREVLTFKVTHTGGITCLAASADGTKIVTGSEDTTVKVWDIKGGVELRTLTGHKARIFSVAISADGAHIVSGGGDGAVKVWDAKTGRETFHFAGHSNGVRAVAISARGERVVSGSEDKTLKVWDAKTGEVLHTLAGHKDAVWSVAFSPDDSRIASAGVDKLIKVWDANTGANLLTLIGHQAVVSSVVYSADGQRIVSGSHRDNTVKIWNARTGDEQRTLRGHTDWVTSVGVSADGDYVVSGSLDYTVKVWNIATANRDTILDGHDAEISSLAFSGDGRRIVSSGDNSAKVWDANTGHLVATLKGHTMRINSVAFSPDGQLIVTGSEDNTLKVWDANTGIPRFTLAGHKGPVSSVAFAADSIRVVSGNRDDGTRKDGSYSVRVWNVKTGSQLLNIDGLPQPIRSVAISPNGERIVSGSQGGGPVKVWSAKTGRSEFSLDAGSVSSVGFSADGQRIITGGTDGNHGLIKVWNASTGAELLALKSQTENVECAAFSKDGKRIISGHAADGSLRIWDTQSGQETFVLKSAAASIGSVAFGAEGDDRERIVYSTDRTAVIIEALRNPKAVR